MSEPDPEDFDFLDYLKPKRQRPPGPPPPTPRPEGTGYAARAFNEEVQHVLDAPEGTRNDTLNVAAFNLGQLVGAGLLEHVAVWQALHSAGLHVGLEPGEVAATLRSGLEGGMREPRQVPELVRDQVPDVTTLGPAQAPLGGGPEAAGQDAEPVVVPPVHERVVPLNWHRLWEQDDDNEWLVEPLLPARRLVALFSPPKVGKSLFLLDLAVHLARGLPFMGSPACDPQVVLYVDFENDPRGDVRTRLQAMGVGPDDLGNLRYLSFPQLQWLDTWAGGQELLAVALHHGAAVVVIDTISRAVSGEENANDTWLQFYRHTGQHLKAAGIACLRLDHTGKDEAKGMRGGSAKYGDVDVVWAMTKVGEDALRLECTANRLPVAPKVLVVDRQHLPLRHSLNGEGMAGVINAQVPALVAALDAAEFPTVGDGAGVNKAAKYLRSTVPGPPTWAACRKAQEERLDRASTDEELTTDPRIKDD